jgi:hypothetical protein
MLVSGWLIKAHVVPIESTPVSLDPDPYQACNLCFNVVRFRGHFDERHFSIAICGRTERTYSRLFRSLLKEHESCSGWTSRRC